MLLGHLHVGMTSIQNGGYFWLKTNYCMYLCCLEFLSGQQLLKFSGHSKSRLLHLSDSSSATISFPSLHSNWLFNIFVIVHCECCFVDIVLWMYSHTTYQTSQESISSSRGIHYTTNTRCLHHHYLHMRTLCEQLLCTVTHSHCHVLLSHYLMNHQWELPA